MDEILGKLDTLSVEELTAIKDRCTELLKSRKEEVKASAKATKTETEAKRVEEAKAKLVVGAEITFTMKGAVRTAKVEKITEKTATVTLPEGKRYIQFRFITNVVAPEAKAEAEAEEQKVA